ncbi:MAG: tryptophan--tRNA ligase [Burkholderiales bacterium]
MNTNTTPTPAVSGRIVSGMRPTGALHLGHYHGVLTSWLRLQSTNECFFFVADWHAMTDADTPLRDEAISEMVLDWLAAGIDPAKATLFIQSRMPEHAELFTLLALHTPLAWLERVPGFKDEANPSFGRLGYPLLQAADILIYKGVAVPVGQDQAAHLELAREVARRMNSRLGSDVFPEPQLLLTEAPRLTGLDGRKMSKSLGNTLAMREAPESTRSKLMAMPTDPARVRREDPGNPANCPVWPLHEVTTPAPERAQLSAGCQSAGIGCVDCKQALLAHLLPQQAVWRERAAAFEPKQVHWMVEVGTERARALARKTLKEVREGLGLHA